MRIHLDDIKAVSQCPAYFKFLSKSIKKPPSVTVQTAMSVIKQGYMAAADIGFRMSWRSIVGHVDREIFRDINVGEDEQIETARKTTEYILLFLQQWYHGIYLAEEAIGFADLNLESGLGRYIITSELPLIKLTDNRAVVVVVDDVQYTENQLNNDIKARGLLWLVAETLGHDRVGMQYMCIKQRGGMDMIEIKVDIDAHKRIKDVILQGATMIEAEMDFPSVTVACNTCSFRRRCRL